MNEARQKSLRLLDTADNIAGSPQPSNADLVFSAREFVQATLPHRSPRGNPQEWYRRNGNYTLSIRPGFKNDPKTGARQCVGYPYGTIPRLLLFWVTTEALRAKSRKLWLGPSLSAFMREIGLNPDNGGTGAKRSDARRLREQLDRLFRATISFHYEDGKVERFINMPLVEEAELWWNPKDPTQIDLFESWIDLGPKFYEAIVANPVPADFRALRALKSSPLALDLYTWLAYRAHRVTQADKPVRISWRQLLDQIGADYGETRDFKPRFKEALAKVLALYPAMRVELAHGGVVIHPCPALMAVS